MPWMRGSPLTAHSILTSPSPSAPSSPLTAPFDSPSQAGTSNSIVLHSRVSRHTSASVPVLTKEGTRTIRVGSSGSGDLSAWSRAGNVAGYLPPTRAVSNSGWFPMMYICGRWDIINGSLSGNGYIPVCQLILTSRVLAR
jgi:hypothetical protein